MADDDAGPPLHEDREPTPLPGDPAPAARPSRTRETWEPQVRELRRPDFAPRLAKTSDLPTEIAQEREKSKLGEHRVAALRWEEADAPEGEAGEGEEADGESEKEPTGSRGQKVTLAALGVVVALLGVMWFAKSLLIGDGAPPLPPAAPSTAGPDAATSVGILSEAEHEQAIQVMKQFLEALTPDDLKPVLRDASRVWPQVQAHQEHTPWKPFVIRRLPSQNEIRVNGKLMAGAVEVDDFRQQVVAMESTPDGIKVDWETYTGQGEMSWDDFQAQRPSAPVLMRVAVEADDYFNDDFADATTHACFRLFSHQDTHRFYGYVERGSPVHAQLSKRIRANPRVLMALRLRYPIGSTNANQVEIAELVADGWLVTESTRIRAIEEAPEEPDIYPTAAGQK